MCGDSGDSVDIFVGGDDSIAGVFSSRGQIVVARWFIYIEIEIDI